MGWGSTVRERQPIYITCVLKRGDMCRDFV
jgi:hypothetical protein